MNSPSTTNSPLRLDLSFRNTVETTSGNTQATAPYPTSFSQIVELIASGDPIPAVQKVSDTVMEGLASQSTMAKRKKPWERDNTGEGTVEAINSVANVA